MEQLLKILVDMEVDPPSLERLRSRAGVEVAVVPPAKESRELDAGLLGTTQVLLCHTPPSNFEALEQLRWIQIASVGYSQLYDLGLTQRGILASNARGLFDPTIAEWNIAMMINLVRDVPAMLNNQRQGQWDRDRRFQRELHGSTVGFWGYGGIARATARLCKSLGQRVHVLARHGVRPRHDTYVLPETGDPEGILPDEVFGPEQWHEFLAGLDFLILALPQTPASTGLLGEKELRALPAAAYILNPARGPIIQEEALLRALREGWIAGAALDTHYYYPMPPDHPLWSMPNVIMTPHISGASGTPPFVTRIWDLFLQNVERFQAGQPLLNQLTDAELDGTD